MGRFLFVAGTLLALMLAGCAGTQGPGAGPAPAEDMAVAQLHALYTDTPFGGGQGTPMHAWLLTGPDTLLFLHWDHADPREAGGLMFVGDGFRAKGCVGPGGIAQDQIEEGYVHFHKESSANWDAGHHTSGDPETVGWWLRHIAADDGVDPMGVGAAPKGEVYPLMPSHENAPACR